MSSSSSSAWWVPQKSRATRRLASSTHQRSAVASRAIGSRQAVSAITGSCSTGSAILKTSKRPAGFDAYTARACAPLASSPLSSVSSTRCRSSFRASRTSWARSWRSRSVREAASSTERTCVSRAGGVANWAGSRLTKTLSTWPPAGRASARRRRRSGVMSLTCMALVYPRAGGSVHRGGGVLEVGDLEDPEILGHHRHGDVEDRHRAERPAERPGVRVTMHDEVGLVLRDRDREAVAAEHRPDLARLALERLSDRRIVQDDDAHRAVRDRAQPGVHRLGLLDALAVDLPQERLAEVGEVAARETADEALGA